MPRSTSSFRLQAKKLFLTYPQCSIPKEEALVLIKDILQRWDPTYIVVSHEHHADGADHLHAFALLGRKCDLGRVDCLDIGGHHGNYQVARSIVSVRNYVIKDGDYVEFGELNTGGGTDRDAAWAQLIEQSSSKAEFLAKAVSTFTRDAVLNLDKLEYFADFAFKPPESAYAPEFPLDSFRESPKMTEWREQRLVPCFFYFYASS